MYFLQNSAGDASNASLANVVMVIANSGNVGIGTTTPAGTIDVEGGTVSSRSGTPLKPQTKLQVAGVISPATNNTYTLGNATYRFTEVYATNGVINTSDRREKKDIYNTDLGLDFLNKLRPVSYRWNTGVDNDVHYGLIAQEAEQAIAEVGKHEKTSIVTHEKPQIAMVFAIQNSFLRLLRPFRNSTTGLWVWRLIKALKTRILQQKPINQNDSCGIFWPHCRAQPHP